MLESARSELATAQQELADLNTKMTAENEGHSSLQDKVSDRTIFVF